MFRTLFLAFVLICFGSIQARSQECGWVFANIYVVDSAGKPIRNAKFEFLERRHPENWAFHGGDDVVKWVEKDSRYFLEEGMCGGHRDVLIKVAGDGYHAASKVLDLQLRNRQRPYVFKVTLDRKNSSKNRSSFKIISL